MVLLKECLLRKCLKAEEVLMEASASAFEGEEVLD